MLVTHFSDRRDPRGRAGGHVDNRAGEALRRRLRSRRMALVALLVLLAAAVGAVSVPQAAAAAELGPGFQEPGKPLNHLGGYRAADGTITYCIDAGLPSPLGGATVGGDEVDVVNGLDSAAMMRLAVVLSRHGATTDARTAAAVALAVWSIADADRFARVGGDTTALLRAPESERPAILALAESFRAEAAGYVRPTARAELSLTIDEQDERLGQLTVELEPATATASVTLTGAAFLPAEAVSPGALAGSSATTGTRAVSDGDRLAFVVLGAGAGAGSTRVSARSDDVTVADVPTGAVRVFSTPNAQTLVAAAAPRALVVSASAVDERDRRTPDLSTRSQPEAVAGGTVRDIATVTGLPVGGALVSFTGHLQAAGATVPSCSEENVVYRSDRPLLLERDGEISSQAFPVAAGHVGTILWKASVTTRSGTVLAEGACGDPDEVTTVRMPPRLPVVSG